jgi:acylphosphatase
MGRGPRDDPNRVIRSPGRAARNPGEARDDAERHEASGRDVGPNRDETVATRDAALIRVRLFVEGRVQGVSFRHYAWHEATRLGLCGWVRNLGDGRVEAVYEGPRAGVEEMLAWTRRGPALARVDTLAIHDEEPQGERGFSVR